MSRAAAAAVVGLMLIGLGSTGCATSRQPAGTRTATAERAGAEAPRGKEIVRLVGQHQTVIVTSGPDGPLYTAQTSDGRTVVANASLAELRAQHPEIYRSIEPAMAVDASLDGGRPSGKAVRSKSSGGGGAVSRDMLMLDSAR